MLPIKPVLSLRSFIAVILTIVTLVSRLNASENSNNNYSWSDLFSLEQNLVHPNGYFLNDPLAFSNLPFLDYGRVLFQTQIKTSGLYLDNSDLDNLQIDKQAFFSLEARLNIIFQSMNNFYIKSNVGYSTTLASENLRTDYFGERKYSPTSNGRFDFLELYLTFLLHGLSKENVQIHAGRFQFSNPNITSPFFTNYQIPEIINGAALRIGNIDSGFVDILAINILDFFQNPKYPLAYSAYVSKETSIIGDFNGDVLSFQSGVIYNSPDLLDEFSHIHLNFFTSVFFTRFGPVYGGVERAGENGNFTDNDYLFHYGGGVLLRFHKLRVLGEISRSDGIDRKEATLLGFSRDVQISGYFSRLGFFIETPGDNNRKHFLKLSIAFFDGPTLNTYGERVNYGYVASGDFQSSGVLTDYIWGYRPFSMTLNQGISNNDSYGFYHSSGALFIRASFGVMWHDWLSINITSTVYFDTTLEESSENILTPGSLFPDAPGRFMGNENNLMILFLIGPKINFFINAGIFFPGELYQTIHNGLDASRKDSFKAGLLGISARF